MQPVLNNKTENPFYGMNSTLRIFQEGSKGALSSGILEEAWKECKTEEQRALLLIVLFSIGDVTGRQHNLFQKSKVDNGGNAQRGVFRDLIFPFILSKYHDIDKEKLFFLITEYTTLDNLLANRVVTKKKSSKVLTVIKNDFIPQSVLVRYLVSLYNGTLFQKVSLAKFLTRPRLSKRKGHKQMLQETWNVMKAKQALLKEFCDAVSLPYAKCKSNINFFGYYKWRKQYNKEFESVLFSTKSVEKLDREEFMTILNSMPSSARFRVRKRLLTDKDELKTKWNKNLGIWFLEWEKYKEEKQGEQRVLEEKVRGGEATEQEIAKLKEVKKEAKVTVGAENFINLFRDIVNGSVDKVKVQPFLDKVNLPFNFLCFVDDSGSMNSSYGHHPFTARQFAAFMATICLTKNPDDSARDLVGLFSADCRLYRNITVKASRPNSLSKVEAQSVASEPLIKPQAHFLDNLKAMKQFFDAKSTGNGTDISSIARAVVNGVRQNPEVKDALIEYPVWVLISDGNFNNLGTADRSLRDCISQIENSLGFRPFFLLIDVAGNTSANITQFQGIEGVIGCPPNPIVIEQVLTNFRDIELYDIYMPLQSLYKSNRYAPVRKLVVSEIKEAINF